MGLLASLMLSHWLKKIFQFIHQQRSDKADSMAEVSPVNSFG